MASQIEATVDQNRSFQKYVMVRVAGGYYFITLNSHTVTPVIPAEGWWDPQNHRYEGYLLNIFIQSFSVYWAATMVQAMSSMLGDSDKHIGSCPCLHGIYSPAGEIKAFIIPDFWQFKVLTKPGLPDLECSRLGGLLALASPSLRLLSLPGGPPGISYTFCRYKTFT